MVSSERQIVRAARRHMQVYGEEKELVLLRTGTQAAIVADHLLPKLYPKNTIRWVSEPSKGILVPLSKEELNAKVLVAFLENADFPLENYFLCDLRQKTLQAYAHKYGLACKDEQLSENELKATALLHEMHDEQITHALHNAYEMIREHMVKNARTD